MAGGHLFLNRKLCFVPPMPAVLAHTAEVRPRRRKQKGRLFPVSQFPNSTATKAEGNTDIRREVGAGLVSWEDTVCLQGSDNL